MVALEPSPICRPCQIDVPLDRARVASHLGLDTTETDALERALSAQVWTLAGAPSDLTEAERWALANHPEFTIRARLTRRTDSDELLWQMAGDGDHRVRRAVACNTRDSALITHLVQQDPDPRVRVAALVDNKYQLQFGGRDQLIDGLVNDPDRDTRLELARHPETPKTILLELHKDKDKEVKATARHYLGRDAPYPWLDDIEYAIYPLLLMAIIFALVAFFSWWLPID